MIRKAPISLKTRAGIAALTIATIAVPLPAAADSVFFSTGNPDGRIATAARPESPGKFEIETGDDFALTAQTSITGATFTGLRVSRDTCCNAQNRLAGDVHPQDAGQNYPL